jgi:hypothetical protein
MRLYYANANEHTFRIMSSAHIWMDHIMERQRNKVCGVDVHKKFLIATNLSRDGIKETKRFSMVIEDLLGFIDWILGNRYKDEARMVELESCRVRPMLRTNF